MKTQTEVKDAFRTVVQPLVISVIAERLEGVIETDYAKCSDAKTPAMKLLYGVCDNIWSALVSSDAGKAFFKSAKTETKKQEAHSVIHSPIENDVARVGNLVGDVVKLRVKYGVTVTLDLVNGELKGYLVKAVADVACKQKLITEEQKLKCIGAPGALAKVA